MIVRYVGNRMDHLAGTFYFLRDKLLVYLDKLCNWTSLLKYLSNTRIQIQLKALGILVKILTGPWMSVMYGNKDRLSNLEAVTILKRCVDKVKEQFETPLSVLGLTEDCFGQKLCPDEDKVLASLLTNVDGTLEKTLQYSSHTGKQHGSVRCGCTCDRTEFSCIFSERIR